MGCEGWQTLWICVLTTGQRPHVGLYVTHSLPGENGMNKDPLRIKLVSPVEKLDPASRLNLGRAHVIDHDFKVQDIGMIDERSLPKLLAYRRDVMDDQNRV